MSGRTRKSSRRHATNIQHHRLELDNDFEVVRARTSTLQGQGRFPADSSRSSLRGHTTWVAGDSWTLDDSDDLNLDPDSQRFDEEMEAGIQERLPPEHGQQRARKQRSKASARPNVFWKENYRQEYLDEMLRADGRGDFINDEQCPDCIARRAEIPSFAEFRCSDCFMPDLTCASCCSRRHARQPFHRIEKWDGLSFSKTTLKALGLVIHLNHSGMRCPLPAAVNVRFRVLHTNGMHEVALSYCGCAREIPRRLQLLRRGLYPATQQNVRTCATFSLLRLLHTISLTAKVGTHDLYRALEVMTHGSEIKRPKSRYRPLMRMLTQWRHLKLLKRGGRAHSSAGAEGTSEGELALRCPSCPHPNINLPDDWMDAPAELQFLYILMLCLDANFRLKNSLVSNYSTDPGLGVGMAYMLPHGAYGRYVLSQADEEDISTCVGFQALAKATTRNARGLRYTGVAAVVCGRSEMLLPSSVGNLQKGERYANVDYVFASAIQSTYLLTIAISYDVVCQWFLNLFRRMRHWPPNLKMRPGLHIRPFIPKFHAPAHKEEDHKQYSLNLADGAAMTDGEAIERVWAPHNILANSTKSAGPGTRQDILDDNFAFWNFQKYISMGTTLMRRYKAAVSDRNKQVEAHRGFTGSLPVDVADEWEEMCAQWSADTYPKTAANPYKVEGADVTDNEARVALEQAEIDSRMPGEPILHETTAVSCIWIGLELEGAQRRVQELAAELADVPTNLQTTALADQRAILRQKIEGWEHLRSVYMPGLLQYANDSGSNLMSTWDSDPNPEDVSLWLPSSVASNRRRAACAEGLPAIELKLRTSQCSSSLHGLRQVLRLKTRMVFYKNKNIRGQREGTRSRAVIDRVHKRAIRFVLKYRVARRAKLELEGPGDWEMVYQELRNDDVRSYASGARKRSSGRRGIWEDGHAPSDRDDSDMLASSEESDVEMGDVARETEAQQRKKRKRGTGETRKALSWIWKSAPIDMDTGDSNADTILRGEWARSRARALRAQEEVLLLREEMRRVLGYLEWSAVQWRGRLSSRTPSNPALGEGLKSYALKQAQLQEDLAVGFRKVWKMPLQDVDSSLGNEDMRTFAPTENDVEDSDRDDGDGDDDGDGGYARSRPAASAADDVDDESDGGGDESDGGGDESDGGGDSRGGSATSAADGREGDDGDGDGEGDGHEAGQNSGDETEYEEDEASE